VLLNEEVRAADLLATAIRAIRIAPWRVLLPAVVVFGLAAAEETLIADFAEHEGLWPVGMVVVGVQAVAAFGLTFYAGLLDRLLGAIARGSPMPQVSRVLRSLPYLRLLVAELAVLTIVTIASALLLVPGLVAFTLFVVVGPLIVRSDIGVVDALETSVRLVRPHFVLALFLLTVPLMIERELIDLVEVAVGHEAVWQLFVVHFAVGVVFGVAIGLLEVALAHRVMAASHPKAP
jgi:hypothetical protein